MAGPFYLPANGQFPTQNGKPVLVTRQEFIACCCSIVQPDCYWMTVWIYDCVNNVWNEANDILSNGYSEVSGEPLKSQYPLWIYSREVPGVGHDKDLSGFPPILITPTIEPTTQEEWRDKFYYVRYCGNGGLPDSYESCPDDPWGTACRNLVAVTVSPKMDCSTDEGNRPAFPPPPSVAVPSDVSTWLCDCDGTVEPPDWEPDPVPPEGCQIYELYYWNCEEDLWEKEPPVITALRHPQGFLERLSPLRIRSWGSAGLCGDPAGNFQLGPTPPAPTQEEIDEYCPSPSPAPDTCPCDQTSWNADTWPCSGILEAYALSDWYVRYDESYEAEQIGSAVVSASENACVWMGTFDFRFRFWDSGANDWGDWNTSSGGCVVRLEAGKWVAGRFSELAVKQSGLDPAGSYTFTAGVNPSEPDDVKATVS